MSIYKKSLWAKIFLISILLVAILTVYSMIKNKEFIGLIWAIPGVLILVFLFSGVIQIKILIDENQIIQDFGFHPYCFYSNKQTALNSNKLTIERE